MPDVLTLYIKLIASFLAERTTLEEFRERYFKLFKSDDSFGPQEEGRTLSSIFTTLDCLDEPQDSLYKATEEELRQECAAAIETLQSLNSGRYKSYENKVETMPEHLQNVYKMLECAFPKGIPRALYRPLIALLSASFKDADLVHLVSHYTGMQKKNVHDDVEDVEFAQGSNTPFLFKIKDLDKKMDEVKKILLPCGYRP
ncbi:hypothetical protein BH24DEI2_BH24DEI2_22830 [soil metagenome]